MVRPPPPANLPSPMPDLDQPRALVFRTAGTNCDAELCRAFALAGCAVDLLHIDRLTADPAPIATADLIAFPGGFSYGDDIASGRILAARIREKLWAPIRDAAQRGVPMIGVCNGFQVMVQLGLLPGPVSGPDAGPDSEPAWPEAAPPAPTAALAHNAGGSFIDTWVGVEPVPSPDGEHRCIWTRDLAPLLANGDYDAATMILPVAHGEGRFVAKDRAALDALEAGGHVALRYSADINGSQNNIAGICDATGRLFGLMPHPERYLDWTRHPAWTRLNSTTRAGTTPGRLMFESAVAAVRSSRVGV